MIVGVFAAMAVCGCGDADGRSMGVAGSPVGGASEATAPTELDPTAPPTTSSSSAPPSPVNYRTVAPDHIRLATLRELLQASSVAVLGSVEELGDAVIFDRDRDGSPYMAGTLTTVKVDRVLFGALNPDAGGRVMFLQNGGTAEGVSVAFEGEPLQLPGDKVLAFGSASGDAPIEGVPGFWTMVFAGVDASGRLEPSVAQEIAPFLAGMSVTEIAREIVELSPVVRPAPPTMTYPPRVPTPSTTPGDSVSASTTG